MGANAATDARSALAGGAGGTSGATARAIDGRELRRVVPKRDADGGYESGSSGVSGSRGTGFGRAASPTAMMRIAKMAEEDDGTDDTGAGSILSSTSSTGPVSRGAAGGGSLSGRDAPGAAETLATGRGGIGTGRS